MVSEQTGATHWPPLRKKLPRHALPRVVCPRHYPKLESVYAISPPFNWYSNMAYNLRDMRQIGSMPFGFRDAEYRPCGEDWTYFVSQGIMTLPSLIIYQIAYMHYAYQSYLRPGPFMRWVHACRTTCLMLLRVLQICVPFGVWLKCVQGSFFDLSELFVCT